MGGWRWSESRIFADYTDYMDKEQISHRTSVSLANHMHQSTTTGRAPSLQSEIKRLNKERDRDPAMYIHSNRVSIHIVLLRRNRLCIHILHFDYQNHTIAVTEVRE